MFLKKETRKDFSNFIKAKKVEIELLKETNKFLENATNLDPLKKWYKKKFYYPSPKGLLLNAEMKQVFICIDEDWVHIQGVGNDGITYNELSFFDEQSARDMCEVVAGTYIKDLEHDAEFYKDMLKRTEEAIAYAKLPEPEKQKQMEKESKKLQKEMLKKSLSSKTKNTWTKKKSKKSDQ